MNTHSKKWKNNIHIRSHGAEGQAKVVEERKSSFRKEVLMPVQVLIT
jgi:hypothetical protein